MSEEKIDLEFQKRSEACDQVEARIKEYVDEYEFDDGESSHMPTELESFLIYDAIHGLLGDDEFIAKFTAWKELCVDRQAALQESEAGAVYECPKCGAEMEISMTATPSSGYFLIAPQSAQAIETAAIMKCVEVCEKAAHGVAGAGIFAEAVRALLPQDGRTQLEQKCMEVANAAFDFGYYDCESPAVDCVEPKLRAIVTNLIGEKK